MNVSKSCVVVVALVLGCAACVLLWASLQSQTFPKPEPQRIAGPSDGTPALEAGVGLDCVWASRRPHMTKILPKYFSKPIRLVEIGVWAGVGSSKIWMDTIPDGSELFLIDAWAKFAPVPNQPLAPGFDAIAAQERNMRYAYLSTFDQVIKAERERPSLRLVIARSRGDRYMADLAPDSVDFVYVDGSHYHADVRKDLLEAKRVMKNEFSIVCGDDLEVFPTPKLVEISKRYDRIDFVHPGKVAEAPDGYHPGVLMAIAEHFPDGVAMQDGFWWVFKRDGKYVRE